MPEARLLYFFNQTPWLLFFCCLFLCGNYLRATIISLESSQTSTTAGQGMYEQYSDNHWTLSVAHAAYQFCCKSWKQIVHHEQPQCQLVDCRQKLFAYVCVCVAYTIRIYSKTSLIRPAWDQGLPVTKKMSLNENCVQSCTCSKKQTLSILEEGEATGCRLCKHCGCTLNKQVTHPGRQEINFCVAKDCASGRRYQLVRSRDERGFIVFHSELPITQLLFEGGVYSKKYGRFSTSTCIIHC